MTLDEYIIQCSDNEPEYLKTIHRKTHVRMMNPRMISGHLQGRILAMICHMIQPTTILEIGTFTGYSALCLAEALPENGTLHSIECDDELENEIRENLNLSTHGQKVVLHIGQALEVIDSINEVFDLVFIDADKREYSSYFNKVFPKVRQGGFIIADNTLWDGKVLKTTELNDHQTIAIKEFNKQISNDQRVQKVMLPLRDGLTIIRKL